MNDKQFITAEACAEVLHLLQEDENISMENDLYESIDPDDENVVAEQDEGTDDSDID